MNIDIGLIKSSTEKVIAITSLQIEGKCEPRLSKVEAYEKLQNLSFFISNLRDLAFSEGYSEKTILELDNINKLLKDKITEISKSLSFIHT